MLLIDDYSRMTWVIFLKEKSKALDKFKEFNSMVKNEMDVRIKYLTYLIEVVKSPPMSLIVFVKIMELRGIF